MVYLSFWMQDESHRLEFFAIENSPDRPRAYFGGGSMRTNCCVLLDASILRFWGLDLLDQCGLVAVRSDRWNNKIKNSLFCESVTISWFSGQLFFFFSWYFSYKLSFKVLNRVFRSLISDFELTFKITVSSINLILYQYLR